jgi:hypothetical protein
VEQRFRSGPRQRLTPGARDLKQGGCIRGRFFLTLAFRAMAINGLEIPFRDNRPTRRTSGNQPANPLE